MVLYDKKAKECFSVPGGYIKNDFPGALPLRPVDFFGPEHSGLCLGGR